jgi:hypothetical protein
VDLVNQPLDEALNSLMTVDRAFTELAVRTAATDLPGTGSARSMSRLPSW